ncbi:hypothetical protein AVEN_175825-1 [Araneus ventricosus]|uniref:Uncharacterized protein n=1 Tax=Araneus ventricosus TaxID=182803 RepID=A0A4Y2F119_ARAVE|nr:hypothetical protein AVEN_175825-1 [Araneus ventricosus]
MQELWSSLWEWKFGETFERILCDCTPPGKTEIRSSNEWEIDSGVVLSESAGSSSTGPVSGLSDQELSTLIQRKVSQIYMEIAVNSNHANSGNMQFLV